MTGAANETGPSSVAREDELRSRILVTLAALLVYRIGCHVPVPGLDRTALSSLFGPGGSPLAVERISVFALGLIPLLSALLFAELAKLAVPPFKRWLAEDARNAAHLNNVVRLAALALAAVQALGIAVALEEVPRLVSDPGLAFRAGAVATMVGGTAFLIWLSDLITRHGIGSGFWLLLAAPVLADLPRATVGMMLLVEGGDIAAVAALAALAYYVLAIAVLAALAKANGGAEFARGSVGPWPVILAYAVLGWLLAAFMLLPLPLSLGDVAGVMGYAHPVKLVLLALLISLFALCYSGAGRLSAASGLGALAAAALIAIAFGFEILVGVLRLPLSVDGRMLVVIVTVALGVLALSEPQGR